MAPKILQFVQKLFRAKWKRQMDYDRSLSRRRKPACVLKSVSSKSSLSGESSNSSLTQHHTDSIDSINFEFRGPAEEGMDLCCVRKCCEKCFCEEGEIIAQDVRKCRRISKRSKIRKSFLRCRNPQVAPQLDACNCASSRCASTSPRSMDSACDVSSRSSCQELECQYRDVYDATGQYRHVIDTTGGIPVQTFANIHASAISHDIVQYNSLSPPYENVPDLEFAGKARMRKLGEEPLYDSVPPRPPRSVKEPKYENVLSVNCIDNCVFRQISSLLDTAQNPSQVVESIQHLHKDYSCVRRTSSADNEINYFYENYDDYENEFNMELERRLSD